MTVNYMFLVAQQLPLYLAWLAGIILSFILWRRHPKVSLLAGTGFGLLLLNSLYAFYYSAVRMPLLLAQTQGSEQFGRVVFMHGLAAAVVSALASALLIAAIFSWRTSGEPEQEHDRTESPAS